MHNQHSYNLNISFDLSTNAALAEKFLAKTNSLQANWHEQRKTIKLRVDGAYVPNIY
jgi:hypothetical protein